MKIFTALVLIGMVATACTGKTIDVNVGNYHDCLTFDGTTTQNSKSCKDKKNPVCNEVLLTPSSTCAYLFIHWGSVSWDTAAYPGLTL